MGSKEHLVINYGKIVHRIGTIYLAATNKGLCYVSSPTEGLEELRDWVEKKRSNATLIEDDKFIEPYAEQLLDYLNNHRRNFNLPLDLKGTDFQESVWQALQHIPYGNTLSYSDIAHSIDKPKAVRAVGAAIGANPLMIVIPCHRVIAKSGHLTGFRGGISTKEKLLAIEKSSG